MPNDRQPVSRSRVVPLARERLAIGRKRVPTGRVNVTTTTTYDTVEIDEPATADEVTVERVRVGALVDEPVEPRFEGDVLVIPVMEEVVITSRRFRVVEEVRIRRRVVTRRHRETVKLRRQKVRIERRPDAGGPSPVPRPPTEPRKPSAP
jgi:uncharacterized protein (TIGR02271 family)